MPKSQVVDAERLYNTQQWKAASTMAAFISWAQSLKSSDEGISGSEGACYTQSVTTDRST
ncbi:hypothetical protein [Paenibacillus planticolens]|uniref:Uncharacterized protein n=1 Tax=Paenibacillus planticolens TaxID=2654976 RepID=A0ABX1ZEM6_9BACL|nr:hypothetical protein [Paenibacillus planticolens]NOU98535.1 hypothetical protein [Paenibacillus planticolens]